MNRVEEIRKEQGISREEIANILGITIESYDDWIKISQTDVIGSIQRSLMPKSGKRNGQTRYTYYLQVQGYSANQAADFGEMMMGYPKGWTDLNA